MEKLICKSLLWKMKLSNDEDYNTTLDKMFLENSNNDLLLELESCSFNCDVTFDILQRYWKYDCKNFSFDDFGKCLLDRMMVERKISLNELAERVGISNVNLSKIKNNKVTAIRFSTLAAICEVLDCEAGDILEYQKD